MNRLLLLAAVAVVALAGCKAKTPQAPASTTTTSTVSVTTPAAPATPAPAPAAASGFDIAIASTPSAQSTLAAANQTIIVAVDFYGMVHDPANQDQKTLAPSQRIEVPATGGTAHFTVPPVDPAQLASVKDGKMQILVNVFSGQNGNPDNKLDCGLFQDDIALAERAPVPIACKVIGEGG